MRAIKGYLRMFREAFDINTEVLYDIDQRLRQPFDQVFPVLDVQPLVNWFQQEVDERLVPYPPERNPDEEVEWESEPQRKYVLGYVLERDQKGNIIPYQRTFGLQRRWHVEVLNDTIAIYNDSDIAIYVFGDRQQKFHKNTGWPYAPEIVWDILVDVPAIQLMSNMLVDYYTAQAAAGWRN